MDSRAAGQAPRAGSADVTRPSMPAPGLALDAMSAKHGRRLRGLEPRCDGRGLRLSQGPPRAGRDRVRHERARPAGRVRERDALPRAAGGDLLRPPRRGRVPLRRRHLRTGSGRAAWRGSTRHAPEPAQRRRRATRSCSWPAARTATSAATARPSASPRGDGPPGSAIARLLGGPILLLHGQPGSARDWARSIPAERATTIAIDRPGWDGSSPPTDLTGNATPRAKHLTVPGSSGRWPPPTILSV